MTRFSAQTETPHSELVFDHADASISSSDAFALTSLEIGSGLSPTALHAASVATVVSDGHVKVQRDSTDGSQVLYRTSVISIVMP